MSMDEIEQHDPEEPWSIQPEESTRAYEAFNVFLTLGPGRTRKAAADILGLSSASLREWQGRHSWDDRVRAYDIQRQTLMREEIEAETMAMRKRHAGVAVFLQKKVAERLALMDPMELTPKDAVLALDMATKLERLSRNANEPTKVELTGANGGPIELAEALGTDDRMALMAQVQAELAKRLANTGGSSQALEEAFIDAEIVDEDG